MYRYYVTFSVQTSLGLGILAIDITVPKAIANPDDVMVLRDYAIQEGYTNVAVVAFSRYGSPEPA